MEKFDSLLNAAKFATTLSGNFRFATSRDRYDVEDILALAETSDNEDPIDEDCFYVVSSGGAIGFCGYDEDIDWLFLPDAVTMEGLPMTYQDVSDFK